MNKRKLIIILTVMTIIAIPCIVFAAASDDPAAQNIRGFFGLDASKLTEQQKADVTEYSQKMQALRKAFIDKMVANGALTKEQGEAASKRLEEMPKDGLGDGFMFGMGGKGRRHGFDMQKIDASKLTDQQKAGLADTYTKMVNLHKEHINKLAADGLMTKEQAAAAITKIEAMLKDIQEIGLSSGMMFFKGGFGPIGMKGMDQATLTDKQKTDLEAYSDKMAELQKEMINKAVSYGLLTQDQGDAMIKRMDEMKDFRGKGFPGGMRMRNATPVPSI